MNPAPIRFHRAAWAFLFYNILVISWGALVRATGSGAGCGNHWPLCNGQWIPSAPQRQTIIEFIHRMMSAVSLVGVMLLWIESRRLFRPGSLVRWGALSALVLTLSEALIGAGLVLLKLVAQDSSGLRALYLSIHLLNTFLLLGALSLIAWAAGRETKTAAGCAPAMRRSSVLLAVAATLAVGVTGGIAALGDTLFPARTFGAGFQQDFSATSHFLIKLRAFHPILAILTALMLVYRSLKGFYGSAGSVDNVWGTALLATVILQLLVGVWNLTALAPVTLQLLHLLLADLLWVFLIFFILDSAPTSA